MNLPGSTISGKFLDKLLKDKVKVCNKRKGKVQRFLLDLGWVFKGIHLKGMDDPEEGSNKSSIPVDQWVGE
jgi:hypothetical protein